MQKYEYLNDTAFLQEVDHLKIRDYYFKAISLDFTTEREIDSVEGLIKNGSINVDGSSAIRRTASLSVFCNTEEKDMRYFKQFFGITKKINLEIGIANLTKKYPQYDILWFPMGLYVITGASISHDVSSGININLQLKDKMVLLNGDFGGTLPAAISLDRITTIDKETGEIIDKKCTIYQLIQELVNHFGGEQLGKIIISDIDNVAKWVVKWDNEMTGYVVANKNENDEESSEVFNYFVTTIRPEDEGDIYATFNQGDYIGYSYTDFTFPSSDWFSCNAGDSIVSMLDKIKSTLGDYEYFYDLNGNFVFRQIRNYRQTSKATMDLKNINNEDYLIDVSGGNAVYSFDDSSIITSYTNSPQYDKIKNDFIIWGLDKQTQKIIRYHLSIDTQPYVKYTSVPEEYRNYILNFDKDKPELTKEQEDEIEIKLTEEQNFYVNSAIKEIGRMILKLDSEKDPIVKAKKREFFFQAEVEIKKDINAYKDYCFEQMETLEGEISQEKEELKTLQEELKEISKGTTDYDKKKEEIVKKKESIENKQNQKSWTNSIYQLICAWDRDAKKDEYVYDFYVNSFVAESLSDEDIADIRENYLYTLFEDEKGELYLPQIYTDNFPIIGEEEQYYLDKKTGFIYSYIANKPNYYLSLQKDALINQEDYQQFIDTYTGLYQEYDTEVYDTQVKVHSIMSTLNDTIEDIDKNFSSYQKNRPDENNIITSLENNLKDISTKQNNLLKNLSASYHATTQSAIKNIVTSYGPKTSTLATIQTYLTHYSKILTLYLTEEKLKSENAKKVDKINAEKTDSKYKEVDKYFKSFDKNYNNIIDSLNEGKSAELIYSNYTSLTKDLNSIFRIINQFYLDYIAIEKWNKEHPDDKKAFPLFYYTRSDTRTKLTTELKNLKHLLDLYWTNTMSQLSQYKSSVLNFTSNYETEIDNAFEEIIRKNIFNTLNQDNLSWSPFTKIQLYKNKSDFPPIDTEAESGKNNSYQSKIGYLDVSTGNIYSKVVTQDYYWNASSIRQRKIFPSDWRTQMYLQSKGQYAQETNCYYEELASEWYKLYTLIPVVDGDDPIYTAVLKPEILEHPYGIDYFVDIINSGSDFINEMNVSNIGRRSYVKVVDGVNCVFSPEPIKDWIILDSTQDNTKIIEECEKLEQPFVQIDTEIFQNCLIQGNKYYSAYEEVKNLLYTYTSYNSAVTLVSIPILYLEPNIRISIKDVYSDISGDFMLKSFSIQLGNSNTMNLSCTQVIETI